MKEGEPILGGPQANSGTRPVVSGVPGDSMVPNNPMVPQTPMPQMPVSQPAPVMPNTDDIILSQPQPKNNKKNKIIVIVAIVVVVVLAGFLILSTLMGGSGTKNVSKEELYTALSDFYYGVYTKVDESDENSTSYYELSDYSYRNLLVIYNNAVGFTPDLSMEEDALFPVSKNWFNAMNENINTTEIAYNNLSSFSSSELSSEEKQLLSEVKSSVKTNLEIIKSNTSVLSNFYQAFIIPVYSMYEDDQIVTCNPTEQINVLLNDDKTSIAAEKYYKLYCQAIEAYGTVEDIDVLGTNMAEASLDAVTSLNEILVAIEQDPFSNIKQLLTEINSDEE